MRVNRQEFLQTLARVQPGLSSSDFIEQSTCYAFADGWVATFNDEICCRTKTGLPDLTGAVRAKQFTSVLENMADEEVDLDATAAELRISGRRKKAGVRMEAEIVLPVEQVETPAAWMPLPAEFGDAVRSVLGAAGTNDEEFLTVCVHVHPDFVEACDRKQAARYDIATGVSRPFLVRASSLGHVAKLDMTKVGETDNWIHFRNKLLVFSCRRHLDEYPDITALLKTRGTPTKLPRGASEAAALAGVFTADDKENDKVNVRLTTDRMVVRGEGAFGWASADLETAYKGDDVVFRISPAMLTKLVKEHETCEITPDKLIVAGERWRYLTCLGRPDASKDAPKPEPSVAAGA